VVSRFKKPKKSAKKTLRREKKNTLDKKRRVTERFGKGEGEKRILGRRLVPNNKKTCLNICRACRRGEDSPLLIKERRQSSDSNYVAMKGKMGCEESSSRWGKKRPPLLISGEPRDRGAPGKKKAICVHGRRLVARLRWRDQCFDGVCGREEGGEKILIPTIGGVTAGDRIVAASAAGGEMWRE